jgi:ATP-dependent DNA helicase RecG
MAVHLSTPVSTLPGVGPIAAADFKLLGITSVRDLLGHLPFRYDDYSKKPPLAQVRDGDAVTVTAKGVRGVVATDARVKVAG